MPLKVVDSRELGTENVVHGCCTDGSSIYFCSWDSPAKIFKVDPDTLNVKSLTLGTTLDVANDIVYHKGYLWTCLYKRNLIIVRIDPNLSEWKIAVSSPTRDYFYPMSLAVDRNKDIIYCGAVYGSVFAINVKNPNSVSYSILSGCPTNYNHAISVMNGALYGWGFKSFDWKNPKNPAFWKYDGTSFTVNDLDVSLTDDLYAYNGYVYGVSEEWEGQAQSPKVCRVDSDLNIEYLSLDGSKIGHNMDGITEYNGKLYISCRSNTYPIVEITPDFSEVRYLAKSTMLPIVYPDEGISIGNFLYLQSMDNIPYGKNRVHKLVYDVSTPTQRCDVLQALITEFSAKKKNPGIWLAVFDLNGDKRIDTNDVSLAQMISNEDECDRMLRCYEDSKYYFTVEKGQGYYSFLYEIDNIDAIFTIEEVWGWDITSQTWKHPSKIEGGKGYLIRSPSRVEKGALANKYCYPTLDDFIAVYNSLKSGEWALIGTSASEIEIKDTLLEGKVLDETGAKKVTNLKRGKAYWIKRTGIIVHFDSEPANADIEVVS